MDMADQGYAQNTINSQLWLVARLSRWLAKEGLALAELTPSALQRFEKYRWEGRGPAPVDRGLRLDVARPVQRVASYDPRDRLVQKNDGHRDATKGVSGATGPGDLVTVGQRVAVTEARALTATSESDITQSLLANWTCSRRDNCCPRSRTFQYSRETGLLRQSTSASQRCTGRISPTSG
jgi:hypothetical protein